MSLQEMRKKAKLSQRELSAASGIKIQAIQHYESGFRNIDSAKLDTLCTLALALNCKISDIVIDEQLKIKIRMTT